MSKRHDVFAAVDVAGGQFQSVALAMPAQEKPARTDLLLQWLDRLDPLCLEKKALGVGNVVEQIVDDGIVTRERRERSSVEKHTAQYRVGGDDVFGK